MHIDLDLNECIKYGTATATGLTALVVSLKRLKKQFWKKKSECQKCGVCKSKLFSLIDLWLKEVEDIRWKCCNEYKTQIAKDMIKIKLETGSEQLKNILCVMGRKGKENRAEAEIYFFKSIREMIDIYEAKWIATDIPLEIVDSVRDMHDRNIVRVFEDVKAEFKREYLSIDEIIRHITNSLIVAYSQFLQDVRKVVDKTNGALKDREYKNIINNNDYVKFSSEYNISFSE